MFIWIKFTHSRPFYFTDSKKVTVHSCYLLFGHFQFTLIHGLTFQVPMQYCSLLLPLVTSKTGHCFCFSSISSFFVELFLQSSPVVYIAFIHLGGFIFQCPFCLFILFMGSSRQEYWMGLSFPSPVDHVLSDLSTMTHPSSVALHDMAYSVTEFNKAMILVISMTSFLWLKFSFFLPSDG